MIEIEAPLEDHTLIQLRCLVVGLAGLSRAGPLHNVGHHTLEVLYAVAGRLHGVVAQILAQGSGVHGCALALCLAVTVFLAAVLFQERLLLLCCTLLVGEPTVAPLYGHHVIRADLGRDLLYAVARLSHIVEAGIVHDRRCRALDLVCESLRTERVGDIGVAGNHVVTQTQRVAHLVAGNKACSIADHVLRQLILSRRLVICSCLHHDPLAQQRLHIVPPDDVGLQNFTRARVNHRRTHGVGLL